MSTWENNVTAVATWQLKHEVAYWKAKAIALQYENKILHDVIREHNYITPSKLPCHKIDEYSDSVNSQEEYDDEPIHHEKVDEEYWQSNQGELEVSEEFIEFLRKNKKFKEDARMEREKLKAKQIEEENLARIESEALETVESHRENMKQLYGDDWRKILALEVSLQADYISEIDKDKPLFWPNIPLNFNHN